MNVKTAPIAAHDEPIIHIGLPKTGSTFLQQAVLSKLKTIEYFGPSKDTAMLAHHYFDDLPADLPILNWGRRRYLVSEENFMQIAPSPAAEWSDAYGRERCIANLLRIYRDYGQFIIVIRRQDRVAESWYKAVAHHYVGGTKNLFIDLPKDTYGQAVILESGMGSIYLSNFDYYLWINRIANAIGRDRIHILLNEELETAPNKFLEKLGTIIGEDLSYIDLSNTNKINVSQTVSSVVDLRYRFFRQVLKNIPGKQFLKFITCRNLTIPPNNKKFIMSYYAKGNRLLAEQFGLNLEEYGYY